MFLFDGPEDSSLCLALAHGAGAPMDNPWMTTIAAALAQEGLRVARFEFPYMQRRRKSGTKGPPDRTLVLERCWEEVVEGLGQPARLIIGGKSMGGRIASLVADRLSVAGLVCLGYPFHPPGKPDRSRTEHLAALRTPALFCQGTRDAFGKPEEVEAYHLSPTISVHWLEDGDHSFKPRVLSGRTLEQNLAEAAEAVLGFAQTVLTG